MTSSVQAMESLATRRLWQVVVASRNPVKVAAVEGGFGALFPDKRIHSEGVAVPSGVADQPMSDAETLCGARHRAEAARQRCPEADFWLGLEGGLEDRDGILAAFAWVVALGPGEGAGQSRTACFELPPPVAQLVRQGLELGEADDRVFGRQDSKRRGGAVGLLTDDAIDRRGLYQPAVSLALLRFKKPELYGFFG